MEWYLKPAAKRGEEMRRDVPSPDAPVKTDAVGNFSGGAAAPTIGYGPKRRPPQPGEPGYQGPDGEPGSETHRRQCIGAYQAVQGLSLERATAQYERQLAEWHATQKG